MERYSVFLKNRVPRSFADNAVCGQAVLTLKGFDCVFRFFAEHSVNRYLRQCVIEKRKKTQVILNDADRLSSAAEPQRIGKQTFGLGNRDSLRIELGKTLDCVVDAPYCVPCGFADNSVRMYKYEQKRAELESDSVSRVKRDYAATGGERSNLAYGYVAAG